MSEIVDIPEIRLDKTKITIVDGFDDSDKIEYWRNTTVALHGYVRATNDLYIAVSDDQDNAKKLVNVLSEFGFGRRITKTKLTTCQMFE
jgi:phage replication-related protein YjqB (UPF0714/DUF867 family)